MTLSTHFVSGAPRQFSPDRKCPSCDEPMSIYNPGPGCRRCNARHLRKHPGIAWVFSK